MEIHHTKGNWMVSNGTQIVAMPSQCKITNNVSGWNYQEAEANANLIAAAPEMPDSLIEARKFLLKTGVTYDNADIYNKINNVIKKATE